MNKYRHIVIHEDFEKLIDKVTEIFRREYNLEPSIIDITKLIALRVQENNLFK